MRSLLLILFLLFFNACSIIGVQRPPRKMEYPLPEKSNLLPLQSYVLSEGEKAKEDLVVFPTENAKSILINYEKLLSEIEKWEALTRELADRLKVELK